MSAPQPHVPTPPLPPGPELRDIHLPGPVHWWPPAPGWWLLALIVLLCIVFVLYKLQQAAARRRWRAAVLAEFERRIAAAGADHGALAAEISQFLRRLALRQQPAAAALDGEAWLAYLDRAGGGEDFRRGIGRALLDAPFRPAVAFDAPALIALARRYTQHALAAEVPRV